MSLINHICNLLSGFGKINISFWSDSDMVKYGGKKRYTKKEKVITGGKAVFKMGPFSARYYLVK